MCEGKIYFLKFEICLYIYQFYLEMDILPGYSLFYGIFIMLALGFDDAFFNRNWLEHDGVIGPDLDC